MVGRETEKAHLKSLLKSDEHEFVAVFGRRRIGKTYLVRESYDYNFTFQHTGLANASKSDQLREFRESLRAAGMKHPKTPKTWFEAFGLLQEHLASLPVGKKVIFIDELSWLDTPKSNFVSALEHFWNGWATARNEKDIVLIVCGSATSWLINKIVRNRGGLHNRLTMKIYVQPFTLQECQQYAEHLRLEFSKRDLLETYMIMGGVPYYWSFLRKGMSLAQNVDNLFFRRNAVLREEYDRLFASVFVNPEAVKSIVQLLSTRNAGYTRKEIVDRLKITDGGRLSRNLNALISSDFVIKYVPFGFGKREEHYKLIDPFCIFYLHFLHLLQL